MIQVDVFWSFAMGASLASAASERLKTENSLIVNKYFIYTVCYLSCIFAPSGAYLLWQHTGWETLFFYSFDEIHGIFACLFAFTNVLLGIAGFLICGGLVRSGHESKVHAIWTTPYICMFSILEFGYDRFFHAGTLEEWRKGIRYPLMDFFSCQVFYTLLVMGIFVIPPLYYAIITWHAGPKMDSDRKWALLGQTMTSYYRVTCIIISGYILLWKIPLVFPKEWAATILPAHWGVDRLFAFLLGQTLFGVTIFLPLMMIPVSNPNKKVKFRRD